MVTLFCSCNIGMRDLPDMYARSVNATSLRDEGRAFISGKSRMHMLQVVM